MAEKEKIKVSLTTVILLFLVFFLIVAMAGMYVYYNYMKSAKDQTNTTVESIEDETVKTQEKTTEISLSDSEKIDINKKLGEYITLPLRQITDMTRSKDFIYNKNFLNEEKNKYYIVLNTMQKEILNEFNQFNDNGEIETSISVNKVNEYYNKIFGINLNEEKLLNANTSYNLRIKDGMLYGSYDTGWGINPFELKAKKLVKNNETNIYTLTAEVLMKIKEYHADFTEFDDDVTIKYGNPEVLTWPEEYEYAELEIQYKKDSEGNNKLVSMSFVKNSNEQVVGNKQSDEEIIRQLFLNKIKEINEKNDEKLIDYRVDKIEILSDSEKQHWIEMGYNTTDVLADVTYSVKPENINATNWDAGNGEKSGEWIINKTACEIIRNGKLADTTSFATSF